MLNVTNIRMDPVLISGRIHVNDLNPESARETSTLLEENNARSHLFTTTEDAEDEDDEGLHLS